MHFEICQAIRDLIQSGDASPFWSRRAAEKIDEIRETMSWIDSRRTQFEFGRHGIRWWTFAGDRANRALCRLLKDHMRLDAQPGSLAIMFRDGLGGAKPAELAETIQFALDSGDVLSVDDEVLNGLKFSQF